MMTSLHLATPDQNEYNEYYHKYVSKVPDGDFLEIYASQASMLQDLLGDLSDDEAEKLHEPYTWTLKFGVESKSEKQIYVLQRAKSETQTVKESSLKLNEAINEVCPRSGKPVVANSLTSYRGYTVGFCNQHCRDDFASDIEGSSGDREFFDKIIEKKKQ